MEIGTLIRELGGGMWISAEIFILTLLFSLPLGLVVAFGRMSKIAPVRWISKLYFGPSQCSDVTTFRFRCNCCFF